MEDNNHGSMEHKFTMKVDDPKNPLKIAFLKSIKGKWKCSACNSFTENHYDQCQACTTNREQKPEQTNETVKLSAPTAPFKFTTKPEPSKPEPNDNKPFSFNFDPPTKTESKPFTFKPQTEPNPFTFNAPQSAKPFTFNAPQPEAKLFTFNPQLNPPKPFSFSTNPSPAPVMGKPPMPQKSTDKKATVSAIPKWVPKIVAPTTPETQMDDNMAFFTDSPATALSAKLRLDVPEKNKMIPELKQCLEKHVESKTVDFVFCTGSGSFGALGLGEDRDDSYERETPCKVILPDKNWVEISCGALTSAAISSDGSCYIWGANDHGNLGVSTQEAATFWHAQQAKFPVEGVKVVQCSMGGAHTAICDSDGRVWSAGTFKNDGPVGHHVNPKTGEIVKDQNSFMLFREVSVMNSSGPSPGRKPRLPPIIDVKSGNNHFLMLDSEGHIWEMGITALGQRFSRRNQQKYLIPRKCPFVSSQSGLRFKRICCGSYFNLAITKSGELYAWGQNNYKQCGVNKRKNPDVIDLPSHVEFEDGVKICQVAAGEHFAIALDENGEVWSWGRNAQNLLGRKTRVQPRKKDQHFDNEPDPDLPKRVPEIPRIKEIGAGSNCWFGISTNNRVYVFGSNLSYATGLGTMDGGAAGDVLFDQRNLRNNFTVESIAGGAQHTMFLLKRVEQAVGAKRKRSLQDEIEKRQRIEPKDEEMVDLVD